MNPNNYVKVGKETLMFDDTVELDRRRAEAFCESLSPRGDPRGAVWRSYHGMPHWLKPVGQSQGRTYADVK